MYVPEQFEVIKHQKVCIPHVVHFFLLPFLIDNCTTVKVEVSLAYNQACYWTGWL